jgi:hypothetical protein
MPGTLVHFELPSPGAARAHGFRSGVFGRPFADPGMPGLEHGSTRTGFRCDETVAP